MNIDRKSWHYWLANEGLYGMLDIREAQSLCSYVQRIIWAPLWYSVSLFLCCFLMLVVLTPVLQFFMPELNELARMAGIMEVIFLSAALFYSIGDRRDDAIRLAMRDGTYTPKPKSKFITIVKAYYRAVKDKMCPLITYK